MQTGFHAAYGDEFLGLRLSRRGQIEVIYDDGAHQRRLWRVVTQAEGGASPAPHSAPPQASSTAERDKAGRDQAARHLAEALRIAAGDARVLPRLQVELDLRDIALESVWQ